MRQRCCSQWQRSTKAKNFQNFIFHMYPGLKVVQESAKLFYFCFRKSLPNKTLTYLQHFCKTFFISNLPLLKTVTAGISWWWYWAKTELADPIIQHFITPSCVVAVGDNDDDVTCHVSFCSSLASARSPVMWLAYQSRDIQILLTTDLIASSLHRLRSLMQSRIFMHRLSL